MVLTYHEIVPERCDYVYSVTTAELDRHLAALRGREAPPEITFDDGHASYLRYGVPLLDAHGFRSTVFVTAGWTGERTGYMTWADLREVVRAGHSVQAHGWSHEWLTTRTAAQLDVELRVARETLEDRLGVPVDAVSVPDGRYNNRVLAAAAAAGYRRVYTSDPFGSSGARAGVAVTGRLMLRRNMSPEQIERWLQAGQSRFSRLRLECGVKRAARAVLGDRLYQHVWRLAGGDSIRTDINNAYAPASSGARGDRA